MRITPRTVATGAVTGLLALGLTGSPAQAITSAEKKQNSAIKKTSKSVASVRKSAKKTDTALKALAKQFGVAAGQLTSTTADTKKNTDTIAAVVPVVQTALTQLRDGLTATADGLKTLAAGTQRLGDFVGAQEYGAVKGRIELPAAAGGTVTLTPALVSSDVPDSGNPATVFGELPIDLSTLPAGAGNATIGLRGVIRSNEADGAATGDPAGQGGALLIVKCGGGTCQTGAGNTVPVGGIVCTAQTPEMDFTLPTTPASTTRQRLVNIQQKVALTATDQPTTTDQGTDLLGGGSCAVRGGGVYLASVNTQFVDIPTSAAPGPKD